MFRPRIITDSRGIAVLRWRLVTDSRGIAVTRSRLVTDSRGVAVTRSRLVTDSRGRAVSISRISYWSLFLPGLELELLGSNIWYQSWSWSFWVLNFFIELELELTSSCILFRR